MTAEVDGFKLNRVVVIDNASGDGSAEGLDNLKLPLTVMHNKENRGFAAACNQGAAGSEADYLLFLNPDTRLHKDPLVKPIAFFQEPENQRIGIVGIQMLDENAQIVRSCARLPTAGRFVSMMFGLDRLFPRLFKSHFMLEWDHRESREVDQVMGSFFLVRGSLFRQLGGFDERFFVYFEEVDLTLRARRAGFQTFYLAEAAAYHKGGGTSEHVKAVRLFYSLRSRIQYAYKHFHWFAAAGVSLGTLFIEPLTRELFAIFRLSLDAMVETAGAYGRLWTAAPRLMVTRGRASK